MSQLYSLAMMIKIIFVFFVLYSFIPAQIIRFEKESRDMLDKVFISMVHCTLITIIIVYFLAFIKLYETISIIAAYIITYFIIIWFRNRTLSGLADAAGLKIIITLLDLSEKRLGLIIQLKRRFRYILKRSFRDAKKYLKYIFLNPFGGILSIVALLIAAYIRFHHSMTHFYLGASDSYVVLAWAKYLGSNDVFKEGIYPYGIEAIISALHKVFLIDPYYITRFIGPLAGFLIVLSVYYVVKKNFNNMHLVLLAVFIYGTVNDSRLLGDTWRQISALPMEYAIIFFLPGLHFMNLFYKTSKNSYLFLAGECVALTLLIHPYVTVFLGISYIIVTLLNIRSFLNLKVFKKIALVMSGSIFLGVLPMLIAMLQGKKFHSTLGYIQEQVTKAPVDDLGFFERISRFQETNPFVLIPFVVILMLLFVYIIRRMIKKDNMDDMQKSLIFILTALAFYVLLRARSLGLPLVMDVGRIGIFLSMVMIIVFSLSALIFDYLISNKLVNRFLKSVYCILVIFFICRYTAWGTAHKGFQMEYDEAVYNYVNIKRNESALKWTIISPVEQYQQVLGYGWHFELWEFVYALSDPDKNKLTIPTDYIFLFIEKIPLRTKETITIEDAQKDFPEIPKLVSGIYMNRESRRILEAKAYYWAQDFMQKHNNMTIYFENERFIVYKIEQDGEKPLNLLR